LIVLSVFIVIELIYLIVHFINLSTICKSGGPGRLNRSSTFIYLDSEFIGVESSNKIFQIKITCTANGSITNQTLAEGKLGDVKTTFLSQIVKKYKLTGEINIYGMICGTYYRTWAGLVYTNKTWAGLVYTNMAWRYNLGNLWSMFAIGSCVLLILNVLFVLK